MLNNYLAIQSAEDKALISAFHFLLIPTYLDTNLHIGSLYGPIEVSPPLHVQLLFAVFFLSLAVSTGSRVMTKLRVLSYLGLSAVSFLASEVLMVSVLYWCNIHFTEAYLYGGYIVASLTGSFLVEACLFKNITRPEGNRIKPQVPRTYIDEFLIFFSMLATSLCLMLAMIGFLMIGSSTLTFSYLVLNIAVIFSFNNFLAYFLIETRIPRWLKRKNPMLESEDITVSFLLPAFNEEKTIRRCIESIDKAASNYSGRTEIVVINDGSTDKTREIASKAILNLKNCDGVVFNIKNSGKGAALRYGLRRTTGEIIFRVDTDSVLDSNAIKPVVAHFSDPSVGSVSGVITPLEERTVWQKIIFLDFLFLYLFYKREEELLDSIMVQSGAFSVFRKDALLRVGGWVEDRYGEDGEITIRLGRFGYKNEFEPRAILRTDQPSDWKRLREQRIRWNVGYYYSRSANFGLLREFRGPRTIIYLFGMYAHGIDFAYAVSLPFFFLGLCLEYFSYGIQRSVFFEDVYKILLIDTILFGLQHMFHIYCAYKFNRSDLIIYLPLIRLYNIINQVVFRLEAMEILLSWSSRWDRYNKESFLALRQTMKITAG
ncbi:MAG TPA: glycosyltransferase [Candidatus Nitrosotalea sp.]|nr:glycosyltransferase [Candidatus Nitrosotalea sp.]